MKRGWIVLPGLFVAIGGVFAMQAPTEEPYVGSSFEEVRRVVFEGDDSVVPRNQEEAAELDSYHRETLPHHTVSWHKFTRWIHHRAVNVLAAAAKRTVTDNHDYYRRLEKLVHSNGICFTGQWSITEDSDYTGYFAKGRKALFIGRGSVSSDDTRIGNKRTMGFAGKLFPTLDPREVVPTANFVTIDNLSGTSDSHYLDVAMTNEPALGFAFTPILTLKLFFAFSAADSNINFRPVSPIAAAGMPASSPIRSPRWIMLKASESVPKNNEIDFRDELKMEHFPEGLDFEIYASDLTKDTGKLKQWKHLGEIHLTESVISYGCDRRLHFHHNKVNRGRRGD